MKSKFNFSSLANGAANSEKAYWIFLSILTVPIKVSLYVFTNYVCSPILSDKTAS